MLLSPFIFLCAAPTSPQFDTVDLAWDQALEQATYDSEHPVEVEAAPDGRLLVLSMDCELSDCSLAQPADVVLRMLDENGDLLWQDAVASPPVTAPYYVGGRFADAAIDGDGNVFLVVSRPDVSVLRRYGTNGTLAWEVGLPETSPTGQSGWRLYSAAWVKVAPSGDVVVGGLADRNTYPRGDVRVFRPDGTSRWEWRGEPASTFGTTAHVFPFGMTIGPDGRIYLYGQSDQPAYQHGPHIIALSPDGDYLWRDWDLWSGTPVIAADFDSQGQVVALAGHTTLTGATQKLIKYRPDGTRVFDTQFGATFPYFSVTSIALDAFDQIRVGGSSLDSPGQAPRAAVLRFDSSGASLGYTAPSVLGQGELSSIQAIDVTPRNDIVAFGFSGPGPDAAVLARFGPDGTERWAERRRGTLPLASQLSSVDLAFTLDTRGNPVTLAQVIEASTPSGQVSKVDVAKFVQNGPAGTPYCGPAPLNSTGAPAMLRGLGPSLTSADNVTLRADHLPVGALTLFLASRTQGSVPNVGGGQGTLCLGGAIGRFFGPGQVRVAKEDGSAALQLHLGGLPQPAGSVAGMAGETWSFQAWYRDSNPGPTSNLTQGVALLLR